MLAPPKPPSHDDLEALIKEARERQLRRRLLGAAGVAVAAAIGLGVYALTIGGSPANLGQPAAKGGRATGPPCRASQLSATIGFQGATGSLLGGAEIRNTGAAACTLPRGRPAVRISLHGRALPVRVVAPPHSFPGKPARVVAPGHKALVWMQWFNWCGKTGAPSVFVLRFRTGVKLRAEEDGLPRCDSPQTASTIYVSRPRAANG